MKVAPGLSLMVGSPRGTPWRLKPEMYLLSKCFVAAAVPSKYTLEPQLLVTITALSAERCCGLENFIDKVHNYEESKMNLGSRLRTRQILFSALILRSLTALSRHTMEEPQLLVTTAALTAQCCCALESFHR